MSERVIFSTSGYKTEEWDVYNKIMLQNEVLQVDEKWISKEIRAVICIWFWRWTPVTVIFPYGSYLYKMNSDLDLDLRVNPYSFRVLRQFQISKNAFSLGQKQVLWGYKTAFINEMQVFEKWHPFLWLTNFSLNM